MARMARCALVPAGPRPGIPRPTDELTVAYPAMTAPRESTTARIPLKHMARSIDRRAVHDDTDTSTSRRNMNGAVSFATIRAPYSRLGDQIIAIVAKHRNAMCQWKRWPYSSRRKKEGI